MKEKDKINFLKLLRKHIFYKDGFWVYNNSELVGEKWVRSFIRQQGIPILERDITDFLSELSHNETDFNVTEYIRESIRKKAGKGKSTYFESLDELYPGNKFRQIMNYYLFSEEYYSFILVGYGQTGKSTFVDVISEIIGEAFFGRSDVQLLKNSHGTAILEGKLFFEVAEAQDLDLNTANKLKSIVTNNTIYINPKFQLQRIIQPKNKLIMTCNNFPKFRVTDDGVIRRFITIDMNNKITKQDPDFLSKVKEDIPNIIRECIDNPFNIEDFALEQYSFFERDPQWGFGFGNPGKIYDLEEEYEKYKDMCKTFGYFSRNKENFDKFIELANIYREKVKCATTLNGLKVPNGLIPLTPLESGDLPF